VLLQPQITKKEMIASRSGKLIFESRREFFKRFFDIQMSTGKAPWLSSIPYNKFRSLYYLIRIREYWEEEKEYWEEVLTLPYSICLSRLAGRGHGHQTFGFIKQADKG